MQSPRIIIAAPDYAAEALRLRVEAAVPEARVEETAGGRGAGAAGEVILAYVEEGADPARVVREMARGGQALVVALCEEPRAAAMAEAVIAEGAADCLSFGCLPPMELGLAIRRAAAQADRLGRCQRRRQTLARALVRCRAERKRAIEAASSDPLTGLFTRRFFDERLAAEVDAAYRSGRPLSLALLDLDGFKAVNDLHGHEAGDRVLGEVGRVIDGAVRGRDVAARFGGDEIAILLPETPAALAREVVHRIAVVLRAREAGAAADGAWVTMSAGIADLPGPHASSGPGLLAAADAALRLAKQQGRDRIGVAGDGGRSAGALELGGLPLARGDAAWTEVERMRGIVRGVSSRLGDALVRELEALLARGGEAGDRGPPAFGRAGTVADYGARIAAGMGLRPEQVDVVRRAGLVQDIGMLPLESEVGHRGDLAERERDLVRLHPALSVRIAEDLKLLREELPIVLHHHESFDGSGYPRGLSGERIPLGSRILAVAGAFEAMTSPRPYRRARDAAGAVREIDSLAGRRYDPAVVGGFRAAFAGSIAS